MRPSTVGVFVLELLALIAWLGLAGADYVRLYHHYTVYDFIVRGHRSTHACVEGVVTVVRLEPDGDWHIRLVDVNDHQSFIIVEEIPTLQGVKGQRPAVGDTTTACGISRRDPKHLWLELHPVEYWEEAIGHE